MFRFEIRTISSPVSWANHVISYLIVGDCGGSCDQALQERARYQRASQPIPSREELLRSAPDQKRHLFPGTRTTDPESQPDVRLDSRYQTERPFQEGQWLHRADGQAASLTMIPQIAQFQQRFKQIPKILELDHLTVTGDVYFGRNVTLRGTVISELDHPARCF